MAKTTCPDTIVIIDDEPHNVVWMVDHFEYEGYRSILCRDANEAVRTIDKEIYRALIVDLSIPIFEPHKSALTELGSAYTKYPGLFIALTARNMGYRGRQVVIYSVHRDLEIDAEARKLGCTYILKGRPKMIREELAAVLVYDPTDDTDD